jgi:hypothetical protein
MKLTAATISTCGYLLAFLFRLLFLVKDLDMVHLNLESVSGLGLYTVYVFFVDAFAAKGHCC